MERRNFLKNTLITAGGCTGCEELAKQIDMKHLDNAYKMGLEL